MTMQLAALNGKYMMTEKRGTLWDNAAVVYFEFPHELQSDPLLSETRFEPGNSQKQNKYASPSPATLSLTNTTYHIICNNSPPEAYYSAYNTL